MCRWMAFLGQTVLIEELLFNSPHGLVDQSLHSRMGAEPTNGDGFGLGWYGTADGPGLYRPLSPAWGDDNWRVRHNDFITDFHALRRDLMLAIDPDLFPDVHGSTDTEVVFYLALTHGLEDDPIGALEQTGGLMEATARRHGLAP